MIISGRPPRGSPSIDEAESPRRLYASWIKSACAPEQLHTDDTRICAAGAKADAVETMAARKRTIERAMVRFQLQAAEI
jgi:hypothetical protein